MRSAAIVNRFVDVSCDLLAQGYGVRFRATGDSMRPAICDGDFVTVEPAAASSLVPGHVIVYRHQGRLFAHRVVSVGIGHAGQRELLLRGDAAPVCDAPVSPAQVVGELVSVSRGPARPALRDVPAMAARALRGLPIVFWRMTSQQGL